MFVRMTLVLAQAVAYRPEHLGVCNRAFDNAVFFTCPGTFVKARLQHFLPPVFASWGKQLS